MFVLYLENFCKDKWRNIRTGFQRSLKDSKRKGHRRFYLHSEMEFLLPYYENKNSKTLNSETNDHDEEFNLSDEFAESPSSLMYDDDNTNISNSTHRDISYSKDILSPTTNPEQIHNVSCNNDEEMMEPDSIKTYTINQDDFDLLQKIKKNKECFAQQMKMRNNYSLNSTPQNINCSNDQENPNLLFFRGILPDIVTLSQRNQRILKSKIITTVNEMHHEEEEFNISNSILNAHIKNENVALE